MASTLTVKKKRTPGKAQATEVESVKPKTAARDKSYHPKQRKPPIKLQKKRTKEEEEYIAAMKEHLPEPDDKLNEKQKTFCKYYSGVIGDCYGNATVSYMRAYQCLYITADKIAWRLLDNDGICRYITKLTGERMTPESVDAELAYVVFQRHDLPSKMRGISEYNKIQGRIKQPDSWMAPVLHEFYMGIVNAVEKNRLKELSPEKERVIIEQ